VSPGDIGATYAWPRRCWLVERIGGRVNVQTWGLSMSDKLCCRLSLVAHNEAMARFRSPSMSIAVLSLNLPTLVLALNGLAFRVGAL